MTMHAFDSRHRRNSEDRPLGLEAPTVVSRDDARQGISENNVIYVLVIGLAGAIFANAIILLGFILLASTK